MSNTSDNINETINASQLWNEHLAMGHMIRAFFKRAIDIFMALLGLLILGPWFALIAFLIKRDSPGPAFFWCNRMGRFGRPFRMLKFRTMFEKPSSYEGPPITCDGDDRITPIGRWLRDTKINELPQLWNVLKGEMSLVGPRPEDVDIANDWPEPARAEILSIRPGMTSPASVLYHDEEHKISSDNVMGAYIKDILPDKMRLDRLYVHNQTLTADLDIIFWTMVIFIPRIAKITIPEGLFFSGPISRFFHRYANWFFADLVISLFVVGIISFLWRLQMPLNWGVEHLALFAVILAFIYSIVNSLTGLNKILWSAATIDDGINLILLNSAVTVAVLLFNVLLSITHWFQIPSLPIVMIIVIGLLEQIGILAARFRFRILTAIASRWLRWRRYSASVGERVLIVGIGEGFYSAAWLLRRYEFRLLFTIVGVVDDNSPAQIGMVVNGCLLLGNIADIPKLVKKHDIGVILFTQKNIPHEVRKEINSLCKTTDLRIAFVNQIMDMLSQEITQPLSIPDRLIWSQDRSKYMALYDLITGLPNRFLFEEQLRRSLAYSRRYTTVVIVLMIHLDKTSKLLRELGQKSHSELLRQVASRLLQQKRESDTLACFGNDEFGLILENISDETMISPISQRIQNSISAPFSIENKQITLKPKILICTNLNDCTTMDDMRTQDIELLFSRKKSLKLKVGD